MFLKPDGTFFFQLVNFAIFFAILNAVFLRPVGDALRNRRAYIDGVHGENERAASDLKNARAEAEQKRAVARREADAVVSRARSAAESEAEAIVNERTVEAQSITDLARATVASEIDTARGRSNELATALAKTLMDRAVGGGS